MIAHYFAFGGFGLGKNNEKMSQNSDKNQSSTKDTSSKAKQEALPQAWFKPWRKQLGLTQKQAAALLGLKPRMIQNYESGDFEVPRYIRLACWALTRRAVDFDHRGVEKVKNLGTRADKLRGTDRKKKGDGKK